MKRIKRVLSSLLAVTALVAVFLAPRASASQLMPTRTTSPGASSPKVPGSAQWNQSVGAPTTSLQALQDTQSSPQTMQDELKAAMEKLESGNGNADAGDTQSDPQTMQDDIRAAIENLKSGDENADVKDQLKKMLRPTVKQVADMKKAKNSSVSNETIVDTVVAMLQQQGITVLDEAALRQIIRQILVEEYPGSENSQEQNNDEELNAQLKEQLRKIVKAIGQKMQDSDLTYKPETIAEGVIAKIKENGTRIVDEAGLKQLILQLIEEEYPSGSSDQTASKGFTSGIFNQENSDEGYQPFSSGQPLYNGYTMGTSELKELYSNNTKELILESVVEVTDLTVLIRCKLVTGSIDAPFTPVEDFTIKSIDTGNVLTHRYPRVTPSEGGYGILQINFIGTIYNHANEEFEVSNARSSVVFKVPERQNGSQASIMTTNSSINSTYDTVLGHIDDVFQKQTGETITKNAHPISLPAANTAAQSTSESCVLTMDPEAIVLNTGKLGQLSSQKKPGVRYSITYEDGVLKVSTTVEPTESVIRAIQREGTELTGGEIYKFIMPDQPVCVSTTTDESRTITVVSQGQTVAVYKFQPGADLSNFDASKDLPEPGEQLNLAGWQWNREGSDRWMEKPSVMPDENLVLTALWWPKEYSVTCNGQKTWVPYGHDLYPPAVDTPEGMVLDHWEWTVEGSTKVIPKPYTMPACNLVATPIWKNAVYTFTIDGVTSKVAPGTALTAPGDPEAREGYRFDGWKWTVAGEEVSTMPTTMPAADVTGTPIWTAISYKLTVNGSTTQVAFGTPLSLTPPEAEEGYSFSGWECTVNGEGVASVPTTMPAGDVVAKPSFKANSYNLVFTDGYGRTLKSETPTYGDVITYPADPVLEGKSFVEWDQTVIRMPAHDVTINARWVDKEIIPPGNQDSEDVTLYTVTFKWSNDGSVEYQLKAGDTIPYPNEELPEGYAWNSNITTMPAYDITITAVKPEL